MSADGWGDQLWCSYSYPLKTGTIASGPLLISPLLELLELESHFIHFEPSELILEARESMPSDRSLED